MKKCIVLLAMRACFWAGVGTVRKKLRRLHQLKERQHRTDAIANRAAEGKHNTFFRSAGGIDL